MDLTWKINYFRQRLYSSKLYRILELVISNILIGYNLNVFCRINFAIIPSDIDEFSKIWKRGSGIDGTKTVLRIIVVVAMESSRPVLRLKKCLKDSNFGHLEAESQKGVAKKLRIGQERGYICSGWAASLFATLVFTSCESFVQPGAYNTEVTTGNAYCTGNGQVNCLANTSFLAGAPQNNLVGGTNSTSNSTTITLTPTQGYWDGVKTVNITESNLVAEKIFAGTTIFGVVGAVSFSSLLGSAIFRDPSTTQMTISTEESLSSYAAGYREIPNINTDDDGYAGGSHVVVANRPTIDCGTTQNTIAARIAHCLAQNGANASWSGSTSGLSSEGDWKLVTRLNAREVWQDQRTLLLWSDDTDYSGSNANWCQATGNHQSDDPSNFCNNTGGSCSDGFSATETLCLGNASVWTPSIQSQIHPLSFCVEVDNSGNPLYSAIAAKGLGNGENFSTGTYDQTKGGMGRIASGTSPSVRWRLPTLHDYGLAEVDGIRYVVNLGFNAVWLATAKADQRANAFIFSRYATVNSSIRSGNASNVRCVGR